MQVQQKNSAVGVIGLAGRSLCLKDRIGGMQIFLSADRRCIRQINSKKITFCIDGRIDPVVDQTPSLCDFNGNVVGGRTHPDRRPIDRVIGFPDSKMMTPRNHCTRLWQGIRVVLHSSEQEKPGHR